MIRFDGVVIRQGDFVLRANLEVAGPGITAVIGPSGGGKSTLLMALAGFVRPAEGRILVSGEDITRRAPDRRPVSILFQEYNLFAHLDVAGNVGLGLRPSLRLSADERARVESVLERTGLGGLGARPVSALSGGQRQRVALARALLRDRPVLLLDEPFAALGPGLKRDMLDLLAEIVAERRLTALMVTHDPQDAKRVAMETLLVADGVAGAPRGTAELFAAPTPALQVYLGNG